TFAVSLPGMLIKTDVWVDLEGFDALTPELAQTVDVCWRARLAGHRVAVVPPAEVHHETAESDPNFAAAWAACRGLRLNHPGVHGFIGGWVWGWFAALGVLLAGLFVKDPGTGVAQARGIVRTLMRPVALWSSQKEARSSRTRPYDAVAEL